MIWFEDRSHNSNKARRYRILREKIRRRFKPVRPGGIVYLKRGRTGEPRDPRNEDAIMDILSRHGASVLRMEKTPPETTIRHLLDAEVVIGVEGSHLAHAVYTLRQGGGVIALHSPARFYNAHKDWADALGMRYGFVIGDENDGGYTVNPSDLLRTIDLVRASIDGKAS